MITNLNYPLRELEFSDLTWEQIQGIVNSGSSNNYFKLGDTKDGATIVDLNNLRVVFAMTNLGQACIAPYGFNHAYYYSDLLTFDMYDSGWYNNTSYARGKGVTYSSILASLPTDMKNVMHTSLHNVTAYRQGSSGGQYQKGVQLKMWVPSKDEWERYSTYMPQSGEYWLEEIERFDASYTTGYNYQVLDYMYFNGVNNGTYSSYFGFRDQYGTVDPGRYGDETAGLVLLFEVWNMNY